MNQPSPRTYDFRRTDRIPKDQIRAICSIHDEFARGLASGLTACLRSNVAVNLISVEQLSQLDFISALPTPACIASLSMAPFKALSLVDINPNLAFALLELLLGGGKSKPAAVTRELTLIEQKILGGIVDEVARNLEGAFRGITNVSFTLQNQQTEPSKVQISAPNDMMIVFTTEIQVGEISGVIKTGIPGGPFKTLIQGFDQKGNVDTEPSEENLIRVLNLVDDSLLTVEAQLRGSSVCFADLLKLKPGDVLLLDRTPEHGIDIDVNGIPKFSGSIVVANRNIAVICAGLRAG